MQLIWVLVCLLCTQANASQEQLRAGIGGTVNVPGYGGLADVDVILRNIGDNSQRQIKSDSAGKYYFACVDDGDYELTFRIQGFLTQKQELKYVFPRSYIIDVVMSIGDMGGEFGSGEYLVVSVLDSKTKTAIEGAEVIIDGEKLRTTNCGKTWRILPAGIYSIKINKNGYSQKDVVATITNKRVSIVAMLETK
jgi:hypothetical protein